MIALAAFKITSSRVVTEHHRPIRSFVKRQGRMTQGQSRALNECLPDYGIELNYGEINFEALFGRSAPNIVEIGFGIFIGDGLWTWMFSYN